MNKKKRRILLLGDVIGMALALLIFVTPFLYMAVNSLKERREANQLKLTLPSVFHWENFAEVVATNNYQIIRAFKNSGLITLGAVIVLILVCSMAGYVIQRRNDFLVHSANNVILAGMMVPAAILPTIWLLQGLHIYKTMFSMIMLETALQIPFTVLLYRGFMSSVPVELEEAGYIDGCNRWNLFGKVVFPLLKPVTATVIILNAVTIFNDFTNPLYFFPGTDNATVQLTLYNFMGKYASAYNLLFADVLIITVPMLILFLFFNKRIVDGMVAGAVKG